MADTPTSHNFVPQDDYNVRLCGICGYSKSQHTTKPIAESGWSKRMPHEHVMSTADQELAHTLKNEFLDLCLNHKASTLVALSAARCAAECFESIINEQGGEVFTVNAPSDFEQLIQLRKLGIEARDVLALLVPYGKIHTVEGVRYPDGSHSEAVDRGERVLNELRATIGKEWEGEALTLKGEQS